MPLHNDRRWLAFAFVLLIAVVAVGALALVAVRHYLGIEVGDVKEILMIIFPALSALAAGAAAFYFGGKE